MSVEHVDRKLAPLTPEWFQSAMTPRHQEDGTRLYVLTPPKREAWSWGCVLAFVVILVALGGWFVLAATR